MNLTKYLERQIRKHKIGAETAASTGQTEYTIQMFKDRAAMYQRCLDMDKALREIAGNTLTSEMDQDWFDEHTGGDADLDSLDFKQAHDEFITTARGVTDHE